MSRNSNKDMRNSNLKRERKKKQENYQPSGTCSYQGIVWEMPEERTGNCPPEDGWTWEMILKGYRPRKEVFDVKNILKGSGSDRSTEAESTLTMRLTYSTAI